MYLALIWVDIMSKEQDTIAIKSHLASIKQCLNDKKAPSPNDLALIRQIAAQYPNDPEFQLLLEVAMNVYLDAEETARLNSNSPNNFFNPYSKEQYQQLLEKENDYFNSAKARERHEIINMILNGARIDDNDLSGKSITSKKAAAFFNDVSSDATKIERQEASELLAFDAKKLKEKHESGIKLTSEEKARESQVNNRVDKIIQEELCDARLNHHKAMHAAEVGKRIEDISIEELVKARGNKILDEVVTIFPKIKEAFIGMEHKLAALIFHNPKAIHAHHNNLSQLKIEAETAFERQKEYENKKAKITVEKTQSIAEVLAHDLVKLKEKQKLSTNLTEQEKIKTNDVKKEIEKVFQDITENMDQHIASKIKTAFTGQEEKLAELILHNPNALHEMNNNVEQLKIEAETAHKLQKQQQNLKLEETKNKEGLSIKTEVSQTSGIEELTNENAKTEDSQAAQAKDEESSEEKKAGRSNKFAEMQAKKKAEAEAKKAVKMIKSVDIIVEEVKNSFASFQNTPNNSKTDINKQNFK
jgi:hypothetical protein